MFKYLIEKEFKQFARNKFLPKLAIGMPLLMIIVTPWALDMSVKNVNFAVVDNDNSTLSRRLSDKIASSAYFTQTGAPGSYPEAMAEIEHGDADLILEIEDGFERNLIQGLPASILISANSINGTKGMLGSSYLSSIVLRFSEELRAENPAMSAELAAMPLIRVSALPRFNPSMNYRFFMLPALMVMLLTLMGGFLPALNVVNEKEIGTIEQINVTPVPKVKFVLAKLIPYWIIGFFELLVCFLIVWAVFGLVPAGSLFTIFAGATLYVIALSGLGVVVSNYSGTLQQAMFVMFFFLITFLLMSGLFTPVRSMPGWAQAITVVNPLKYQMDIMRYVYLKGSAASQLSLQFAALIIFAVGSNVWAVLSYRKSR